jgi:drug/metabolite transporter (DMT)-like permease
MQRSHAIGFVVFCVLSGSEWLVDMTYPSSLPFLERQALHYFAIALLAGAYVLLRSRKAELLQIPLLSFAAASIVLLGLPALLNESAHAVSARSGVALFALTPLFLVVGASAFHFTDAGPQSRRVLMMPALIGFAGALLLPPFQLPSNARMGLLFAVVCGAVLLTATGSLWMHRLLRGHAIVPALAILCGTNALFLAAAVLLSHFERPTAGDIGVELLRSVILDLPQLVLLLWLMRELDPVRFGSRFLLAPLLSILEALIFLRMPIDLRMAGTVVLMAIGGAILLLWNAPADAESPPSLGLR